MLQVSQIVGAVLAWVEDGDKLARKHPEGRCCGEICSGVGNLEVGIVLI